MYFLGVLVGNMDVFDWGELHQYFVLFIYIYRVGNYRIYRAEVTVVLLLKNLLSLNKIIT